LDLVADLSARQGFQTVDLLTLMKPYADKELLYFRDDDHLNERGNQVVADLIREAVFPH
jgi:GTPase Era involved in 16S rRNA processing